MRRRKRTIGDGVTTTLCYRPRYHPVECLEASLESLSDATDLPHCVNVVVQGCSRKLIRREIKLPPATDYPFDLKYTMNEPDLGDADVMARGMAECESRYWAFLSHDILLPQQGWDLLLRCLRNEERRKEHKTLAATMACIDRNEEKSKVIKVQKKKVGIVDGVHSERSEDFAIWHICGVAKYGPIIIARSKAEAAGCCFDGDYVGNGHWLDFSMQVRSSELQIMRVLQPGAQLNLGCSTCGPSRSILTMDDAPRFFKKWKKDFDKVVTKEIS